MRSLNDFDADSANVMIGGACDKQITEEDKHKKTEELKKKKEYLNWCYELVKARKEGNKEAEKD
jgi:hypothetical protein